MNRIDVKRAIRIACTLALCLCAAVNASAQCENKSGFAKQVCEVQAATQPSGNGGLALPTGLTDPKGPAITTGLADTIHPDTLPPTAVDPSFKPLMSLDRADDGAFILKVGFYEAYVQSYTLDPVPNKTVPGGFYPAPILGRRAAALAGLLKQIELHPEVPQADVQQLLFAIVHGADLENMPPAMQQTAARVLPKDMLAQLQGAAQTKAMEKTLMGILNGRIKNNGVSKAQSQINNAANQAAKAAAALPAIGDAKSAAAPTEPAARGTWAQMPGGFYVRYLPDGFTKTRLQVIVPDDAVAQAGNHLVFDPTQYLAVLSIAPSQRIGVSLRPAEAKR